MKLSVLGVRGSMPVADGRFLEYGGNTSCICLECGEDLVCFDAGSGLAGLAGRLAGVRRLDILVSHVHLDHIIGLVDLGALRGPEVRLYGGAQEGSCFREQLETVIGPPYWPVGLKDFSRLVQVCEIAREEDFLLENGLRVSTLEGNHPGGSTLYRVELGEKRVTYALDCEMSESLFPRLRDFASGSSLLIWDASFTQADKCSGWGHSTWQEGLALGRAAGAERVLMTHYSRGYSDDFLREQEKLALRECDRCIFAREGMVISL